MYDCTSIRKNTNFAGSIYVNGVLFWPHLVTRVFLQISVACGVFVKAAAPNNEISMQVAVNKHIWDLQCFEWVVMARGQLLL